MSAFLRLSRRSLCCVGAVLGLMAGLQAQDCPDDAGQFVGVTDINLQSSILDGLVSGGSVAYDALPDTIFLCEGDELVVDFLEGSANYTEDVGASAQAGIAYGLYNPGPTYFGPDFDPLVFDPNAAFQTYPEINGGRYQAVVAPNYESQDFSLPVLNYIDADAIANNVSVNLGPDGPERPLILTYVPVTTDSLSADRVGFQLAITAPDGSFIEPYCLDVSATQRITFGFLDAIDAGEPDVNECNGSFTIQGGLSQVTDGSNYEITITNQADGSEVPLPLGATGYRHGDVVSYSVPDAGTYEISVTDGVSCGFSTTVTHTACATPPEPSQDLQITATSNPISCNGNTDGTITATVSGGTPPYLVGYTRTFPVTPPLRESVTINSDGAVQFERLESGTYRVDVEDATGALDTQNDVEILESGITVEIQVVEGLDCFDDEAGGTLTAVLFDGANPLPNDEVEDYDFIWSTEETTQSITNVAPGTYTVTATNRNTGCTSNDSDNFRAPNRLVIEGTSRTSSPATCTGVSDGVVNIPITGGTQDADGNYAIAWSDGVEQSDSEINRSDLQPGDYTATITDANGCTTSIDVTIQAEKTIVLTTDSSSVSCVGDSDGTVSVTAATDGAPASLPYSASLLDADGTEVAPFENLDGDGSTPLVFDNLAPGSYTIFLRDNDPEGCEVQQTVTVTEPEPLEIADVVTTNVGCPDEAGTATINVTGGTAPYTYFFRNDSLPDPVDSTMTFDSLTVDNLDNIGDLQADTNYVVIVTDANGCIDSTTFSIFSPPRATVQPIASSFVSCPDDTDGQLSVVATPPPGDSITIVSYAWFRLNPDNTLGEQVAGEAQTEANLSVGAYAVEVTLSNDCTSFAFGLVNSPGLVSLDSTNVLPPSCRGEATGSIFLFPIGGTPNVDGSYNYIYSTAPDDTVRSNNLNGLAAGTYDIRIVDANGCTPFDTTITIEDPVGIELPNGIETTDVSCPSDEVMDGTAAVNPILSDGTTASFDFFWSTLDTVRSEPSASLNGLARGPISVTITDGECPRVYLDTIGSPEEFSYDETVEDVSCNGLTDGSATVAVTGGSPGYTFDWVDQAETTNTLSDVGEGEYQLAIMDANNCLDTLAVTIQQPDSLILAINDQQTTPLVTCNDDEDGVLSVFVASTNNNPLGDNPFTWSDNVEDNDDAVAQNLAPGTYSVTVTDTRGCADSVDYTIVNPQPIVFGLDTINEPVCFGETTDIRIDTALGGQAGSFDGYTFSLNEDGFRIPSDQTGTAFAGELIVTVFDSVGCSAADTFQIAQPEEITIDLPPRIVVELGDSLQQLTPLVSPASEGYTYEWTRTDGGPIDGELSSDSIRTPFVDVRDDREFTLTVTDEKGCEAIDDILVLLDANRNLFIPNVFRPVAGSTNDMLRIFGCRGVVAINRATIYNRWGGLIAEAEDLPPDCSGGTPIWNGANPGRKLVDPGVYVYVIEVAFLDGVVLTYRGDVTVVR